MVFEIIDSIESHSGYKNWQWGECWLYGLISLSFYILLHFIFLVLCPSVYTVCLFVFTYLYIYYKPVQLEDCSNRISLFCAMTIKIILFYLSSFSICLRSAALSTNINVKPSNQYKILIATAPPDLVEEQQVSIGVPVGKPKVKPWILNWCYFP